jgi:hypothetical protein
LTVSHFLINYPFADRLYPNALEVIEHVKQWGTIVILSDGDVVFQPRKVERSGLFEAVGGNVLIYIHKDQELDDVEQRYPARRYVMMDDKVWLLAAMKQIWGVRLRTVFVRQGHYALAPDVAEYPKPDITVERTVANGLGHQHCQALAAAGGGQRPGFTLLATQPGSASAADAFLSHRQISTDLRRR